MKKILMALFLTFSIAFLTACGSSNGSVLSKGKSLSTSDLSIDSFIWSTEASKCYGYDCYVFSLKNNSNYDIIGVDVTYKVKDSATIEQLKVYDSFMKEHDGYIEEDDSPKNVTLRGEQNALISKGENTSNISLTIGYKDWSWYTSPTNEQFNLMEIKEVQLGIVGNDNKLYIAYYDFISKSWKLDTVKKDIDTWSNSSLAKMLDKPNDKHHLVTRDDDDQFAFYSYGISKDGYKEYVEKIKLLGFEDDSASSSNFRAEKSDGFGVRAEYSEENKRMYVRLYKD